MNEQPLIGYEIHTLDNLIGNLFCAYQAQKQEGSDLTKMQRWIIGYIYSKTGQELFQKDIEAQFHISGSTVTGILKLMEKNGYIIRKPHPSDARLKQLLLTDKSISLHQSVMNDFQQMEQQLKKGISEEQLQVFFDVISQIKNNIKQDILISKK